MVDQQRAIPESTPRFAPGGTSKRILDVLLSGVGLLVLSPLLLFLALIVRLDSRGPVFHRRRVMGRNGGQFDAFKFRSMYVDGDAILARHPELRESLARDHKLLKDPRVTRCGAWMRKLSLDELPQLYNVWLGEMSLVGPRMISPPELQRYGECAAELLSVRPGITGLWQVSGRSALSPEDRVRLDLTYVRTQSVGLDIALLLKTVPAVLRGRGAY
jgi:lipopolysaccharide/colanic/teichoic acid biosynthesis glycosyltransferase